MVAVRHLLPSVIVGLGGAVAGDIINVPLDQPTIQAGVDAAADGDEVVVAEGVYTGPGNREIETGTKLITVRGAGAPGACIIDCERGGRAFTISGGARIEGFTVRNGLAVQGGAMFLAGDATIVGCLFEANTAGAGGGLYVDASSPTVIGCTFIENGAVAGDGGAVYNLWGGPVLVNCLLAGNSAAEFGGGIFSDLAYLDLVNCTLSENTAHNGGGITNYAGVEMTLSNCILWGNEATIGDVLSAQILSTSSAEIVNYTCIEGLDGAFGGEGNIDADPLLADAAEGDFRLLPGSPCIDAADNTALPTEIIEDLDGNPRFVNDGSTPDTGKGSCPLVDMGGYEFQETSAPCCAWDLDDDGHVTTADLLDLLAAWGSDPGGPPDFDGDGNVGTADLLDMLANWGPCP